MLFIFQDVSTVGGDREEEVFVIYFPVVSLTIFQDTSSTALNFLIHTVPKNFMEGSNLHLCPFYI